MAWDSTKGNFKDVVRDPLDSKTIWAEDYNELVIDHKTHRDDIDKHREIDDLSTLTTDLWSANKIATELATKTNVGHTHTSSNITDFTTAVDTNTNVSLSTTHRSLVNNPHNTSLEQVRTISNSIAGDINASSNTITALKTPVNDSDAATKGYVDNLVQGLDWKESVKDKDLNTPPGSPALGDRYIIGGTPTGDWTGHALDLTEWKGSSWQFWDADNGDSTYVEDEQIYYRFNGTIWIMYGNVLNHSSLTGLGNDDHTQYHNDTRGDARYYTKTQIDSNYTNMTHDHNGGDGAQIDHVNLANKGTNTHAQIDSHISNTSNPHTVTKAQVGLSNVVNLDTSTTANITDSVDKRFITDAKLGYLDQDVKTTASPSFAGLNVDSNTLKVDATNNRVGVNNATPAYALDVVGVISANSGTTNSSFRAVSSDPYAGISFYDNTTVTASGVYGVADNLVLNVGGTDRVTVLSGGNVGVGDSNPSSKLTVGGTLEIKNSTPSLKLTDTDNLASYSNIGSFFNGTTGTGLDIDVFTPDVAGLADIRLFRSTNTTATTSLQILKGDNTTATNVRFYGKGGNSYINSDSTLKLGVGTNTPTETLSVNGSFGTTGFKLHTAAGTTGTSGDYTTGFQVEFNKEHSFTPSVNWRYLIRATTQSTSSNTGACALFWYNDTTSLWEVRMVSQQPSVSNNPQFYTDGVNCYIWTASTLAYTIRYTVEAYYVYEQDSTIHTFGAEGMWQRYNADVGYLDGNVGIGTLTPTRKLQVQGGTSTAIGIRGTSDTDQQYILFGDVTNDATGRILYEHSTDKMHLGTQGATYTLSIFGNNVGIGTNTPTAPLDVNGLAQFRKGEGYSTYTTPSIALTYQGTDDYAHFIHTRHRGGTAANNGIDFYTGDGTQNGVYPTNAIHGMSIENGRVGIGTTNPTTKLHINQTANEIAHRIDSSATTVADIYSYSNAVRTGTGTNSQVSIHTNNPSSTGNSVLIQQDGAGRGLVVDQNGNADAFYIDSEATSNTKSGIYVNMLEDNVDGAKGIFLTRSDNNTQTYLLNNATSVNGSNYFYRNKDSTYTAGPVVKITQDHVSDDQYALSIQQDGTGTGFSIQNNGTGYGQFITQTGATTQYGFAVSETTGGSSNNAVYLAGGLAKNYRTALFYRNLDSTLTNDPAVTITQDHASDDQYALRINQDGTSHAVGIFNNNGGSNTNYVTLASGSTDLYRTAVFYRNLDSTATGSAVVTLSQDHASDDQNALSLLQDGTGIGIFIDQNGNGTALNIDSEATSNGQYGLYINMLEDNIDGARGALITRSDNFTQTYLVNNATNTNGSNYFYRARDAAYTAGPVVKIQQGSVTDDQYALMVRQEGTGRGTLIDQNGEGIALEIDSEAVALPSVQVVGALTGNQNMVIFGNNGNHASADKAVLLAYQNHSSSVAAAARFSNVGSGPNIDIVGGTGAGINMNNKDIRNIQVAEFNGVIDNGSSGTAKTIDWQVGNFQKLTLTGNCTLTFTAPTGTARLQLELVQDGTGSRTVVWPATVKWTGDSAPTLTTTINRRDFVTLFYNGTNYYGSIVKNFV